jgi:hypothetical protein
MKGIRGKMDGSGGSGEKVRKKSFFFFSSKMRFSFDDEEEKFELDKKLN